MWTIVGYRPYVSKKTGQAGYVIFLQRPCVSPAVGTECRVIFPTNVPEPVIGDEITVY